MKQEESIQSTQTIQKGFVGPLERLLGRRSGWVLELGCGFFLFLAAKRFLSRLEAANIADVFEAQRLQSVKGNGRAAPRAAVQGYVVLLGDAWTVGKLVNVLVLDVDSVVQKACGELGRRPDIDKQ